MFFDWYYLNVFIPFIGDTRTSFDGWEKSTDIPSDLFAVSWNDGDILQLSA